MNFVKYFIGGLIVLVYQVTLSATNINPYHIKITSKDKLPGNYVYDIYEDSKGFIWVCTNFGLSRYDGFTFKIYNSKDQTSLAGSNIMEDAKGRIWYENFDGFVYYIENDSLKKLPKFKPNKYVPFSLNDNFLYLFQEDGLVIFNINTLQPIKNFEFSYQHIKSIITLSNRALILDFNRLFMIDENLNLKKVLEFEVSNISDYYLLGNGTKFWISTRNQSPQIIHEYDDKIKLISSQSISENFLIHSISELNNQWFICHNNGLNIVDKSNKITNYFNGVSISKIIKDKRGNLWMSTLGQGIFLIPDIQTLQYTFQEIKPGKITYNPLGYYLTSKDGCIYHLNNDLSTHQKIYADAGKTDISNMQLDEKANILFISSGNFSAINPLTGQTYFYIKDAVKEVVKISNEKYATASSNSMSYLILNEQSKSLVEYKNITFQRVKNIDYNPSLNEIIFSSNLGLFSLRDHTIQEIKQDTGSFFSSRAYWINNDIIALNSRGNLFLIKDKRRFIFLNLILRLDESSILNLKVMNDKIGILTKNQIIVYDYAESELLHSGYHNDNLEVVDFITDDSNLIITTPEGLIKQKMSIHRASTPKFLINYITVNENLSDSEKLKSLKYTQNRVSINYSILDFGNNTPFELKYKINRGNWEKARTDSRNLDFQSLAPGEYKIQFCLNNQILSKKVFIKITPPFWETWWFMLLAFCTITLGIYLYIKRQYALMKNQVELMKQKYTLEKELKKSVMTRIRTQMNPHFFYNALNTIQAYIFTNDKNKANSYLAKFSKLTRLILENSEKETISLKDEISSLNLYLELEEMRFKDNFEFNIHISDQIDLDSIEIPPMLIQPYVENAIKHGLLHSEHNRILTINFEIEDNILKVLVDDNGIGRKRAEEINQINKDKHQSFSTKANESRLEILNREKNSKMFVEYIDKYNKNGVPSGTTVIITIPISDND